MAINPIKWPALSEWKQILTRTWKEAGDDDVGLLAAGVAFYFFLAFVPLLASIVLTYGLVADPSTVAEHIRTLAQTLPREAAAIIGDQLKAITGDKSGSHGFGLLLAIGLAVYGASKGAGAIVKALNIAYEIKETRGFIKTTLLALAITLGLMVMIAAATLAASTISFVEQLLPFSSPFVHVLLQIVSALFAVAVVGLGIALLYRYGPDRPDAPWAWVTPGSAAATLLWVTASTGFGLYVSNFGNYNATYGSLGGVVVFLTWLYITSYVLLMGGELNSELERMQSEKQPELAPAATPQPGAAVGEAPKAEPASLPRPIGRTVPPQDPNGGKGTLALLLGGGAALGFKLWRRHKQRRDNARVFYEYPEEGATLRIDA
ncbi:MAG TPA: YihY/virulence factor BrkB family protein [Allosphingosinicella sp.]|jgi:membrane protein